ncbi:hypothetical protein V6N13_047707 [Hibiscus sabdariffa]
MLIDAEEAQKQLQTSESTVEEMVAGGVASCAVVLAVVVFVRKKNASKTVNLLPIDGTGSSNRDRSGGSGHRMSIAAGLCRHFSLSEIKSGTKNFSQSKVIGVGGFGKESPGGDDEAEDMAKDAYDTATLSIEEEIADDEVYSPRLTPVFSMIADPRGR